VSTLASAPTETSPSSEFVKGLGLTSATTLVMGSMIGSGIFIVSADIARLTDSPGLLIMAWVVTGFMTVTGALAYGELAAMLPKAGGQYIFLRESLGPLWGFLYGWTLFLVIQTGTIAAVGVAFGKFMGQFYPWISADKWIWHIAHVPPYHIRSLVFGNLDVGLNTQNLMGIIIIVALTIVNFFGVRTGAFVQNIFTVSKVGALAALIVVAAFVGRNAQAIAANFGHFWQNAGLGVRHDVMEGVGAPVLVGTIAIVAVSQVGSLFSADAWNNVTFAAAEVKNPKRNLPLALALGTGVVITLYIAANFVYLAVLPVNGDPHGATVFARGIKYATEDRVGTAVMQQMFGSLGAGLMAVAILLSTFGCNNGLILSGARVYYAMARDGLFFRAVGKLNSRFKTPAISLVVQALWASILCISGSYNQLLNYVIFAVLVFYILTILGLFVLRFTRPNAERPYKAIGYPLLPAVYIIFAIYIDVVLLLYQPQYTWPGLIIVLLGIPVYFAWSQLGAKSRLAEA
jgi:APA family basic amino acid/polyamine antiporter